MTRDERNELPALITFAGALSAAVTHQDALYAVLDAVDAGVRIRDLREAVNEWERMRLAEVQTVVAS